MGTPLLIQGVISTMGELQALAALNGYCLELCEGFKGKHGPFLCLSLWQGGCRGWFQLWGLFPILFSCFLAPWGCPGAAWLGAHKMLLCSTHLSITVDFGWARLGGM